jgi:hypothetical protein
VFPFGICSALTIFQRDVLGIFSYLIHKCIEVYMDDFMTYDDSFTSALSHLDKVLKRCVESNVTLSNEKCAMMLTKCIFIGNHISPACIWVTPLNIQVILKLPPLETQKEVRIFLVKVGYYRRFMENFVKNHALYSYYS